ncbi:hypothetical protein BDV93DRAFT_538677 [Ceratobasidium sp. AG-I]|nr:hypothetical protein BDV93DRAFT_538677 [Ceratobasidium sp. AG-I]
MAHLRSPTPRLSPSSLGASKISDSDYFQKSTQFRIWLRNEKGKYFDELTGERARHYFRKFVKAWNRGQLPQELYGADAATESAQPASSQTAYKWSFVNNRSKVNKDELKAAREAVGQATYGQDGPSDVAPRRTLGPSLPPSERTVGPTLPSASDLTLHRESEVDDARKDRKASHKRARERLEDEDGGIGPKQVGREGAMDKKRARRDEDRAMRDRKEDGGLEVSEDLLLGAGSSDSFKAAIAKRDAARARWAEKKQAGGGGGPSNERVDAMKARDAQTMAMFQNMAKQRFG